MLEENAFLVKMEMNKQDRIRTRTWWQQRVGGPQECRDVESCHPEVPALGRRAAAAAVRALTSSQEYTMLTPEDVHCCLEGTRTTPDNDTGSQFNTSHIVY